MKHSNENMAAGASDKEECRTPTLAGPAPRRSVTFSENEDLTLGKESDTSFVPPKRRTGRRTRRRRPQVAGPPVKEQAPKSVAEQHIDDFQSRLTPASLLEIADRVIQSDAIEMGIERPIGGVPNNGKRSLFPLSYCPKCIERISSYFNGTDMSQRILNENKEEQRREEEEKEEKDTKVVFTDTKGMALKLLEALNLRCYDHVSIEGTNKLAMERGGRSYGIPLSVASLIDSSKELECKTDRLYDKLAGSDTVAASFSTGTVMGFESSPLSFVSDNISRTHMQCVEDNVDYGSLRLNCKCMKSEEWPTTRIRDLMRLSTASDEDCSGTSDKHGTVVVNTAPTRDSSTPIGVAASCDSDRDGTDCGSTTTSSRDNSPIGVSVGGDNDKVGADGGNVTDTEDGNPNGTTTTSDGTDSGIITATEDGIRSGDDAGGDVSSTTDTSVDANKGIDSDSDDYIITRMSGDSDIDSSDEETICACVDDGIDSDDLSGSIERDEDSVFFLPVNGEDRISIDRLVPPDDIDFRPKRSLPVVSTAEEFDNDEWADLRASSLCLSLCRHSAECSVNDTNRSKLINSVLLVRLPPTEENEKIGIASPSTAGEEVFGVAASPDNPIMFSLGSTTYESTNGHIYHKCDPWGDDNQSIRSSDYGHHGYTKKKSGRRIFLQQPTAKVHTVVHTVAAPFFKSGPISNIDHSNDYGFYKTFRVVLPGDFTGQYNDKSLDWRSQLYTNMTMTLARRECAWPGKEHGNVLPGKINDSWLDLRNRGVLNINVVSDDSGDLSGNYLRAIREDRGKDDIAAHLACINVLDAETNLNTLAGKLQDILDGPLKEVVVELERNRQMSLSTETPATTHESQQLATEERLLYGKLRLCSQNYNTWRRGLRTLQLDIAATKSQIEQNLKGPFCVLHAKTTSCI
uniref:Wsv260-like protein n=1 Tax=Trachysalambria curvirostris nimavirus TaxID=2984282 RepID=A0A9C7F787_9VIRU|nr:MAG: wsv260-like protein [Trachysalambria curvirostris nimavirus]